MVVLSRRVLSRYRLFSLYNSPYPAHSAGCAIDLYPAPEDGAPSPVAGTVTATRTVTAPDKPYAAPEDHLIVIETDRGVAPIARVLHVDPSVAAGDDVAIGDDLGDLVRSGYFAPWVDNHLHLGFRARDDNPYRASGSQRIELSAPPIPVTWNGTGRVIEKDSTYVVLDQPTHPAPGDRFAGIAAGTGVIDGGLPHYEGGGLLGGTAETVELCGTTVGKATDRNIAWEPVTVEANGREITGISLGCYRDRLGVKLVSWEGFAVDVGDAVEVTIRPPAAN